MRKGETEQEADSGVEDAVEEEGLAVEEETGVTQTFTATVLLYSSTPEID